MGSEAFLLTCGDKICPCRDGDPCHYRTYGSGRAMLLEVNLHEMNLRRLRCMVTNNPAVTLHHCHGGSIKEVGLHVGTGQRQNPFLQIPLHAKYHIGD